MNDSIYLPRTWQELWSLDNFTRDPIPKDLMVKGVLKGDYDMDPKAGLEPCGIENCHKLHRRGYVVVLPDARKSNVGKDCGKTKFRADWNRMRSDYSRLKRAHAKTSALRELRSELRELIAGWPNLETRETQWARSVLASFDGISADVRAILTSRAAQNDTRVPGQRYETDAEVKAREFRTNTKNTLARLISFDHGKLQGLSGIRAVTRVDTILDERIPRMLSDAKVIADSTSASTDELRATIRRLQSVKGELEASVRHLRAFVERSNLALLPLMRALQQLGVTGVEFVEAPLPLFRVTTRKP